MMNLQKNKYILGISAFYHDSAVAILKNNEIIAAAQEERFSRKKHDPRFPVNALNYCLGEAFIEPEEIDLIVFYDNPLLTFDRALKNSIMVGEKGFEVFNGAVKSVLGIKLWVEKHLLQTIGSLGKTGKVLFTGHHLSHAASAFFPSSFHEAAIITLDGVGEWQTTTIGRGKENNIEILKEINYPHSIGLLYSAFTYYCGFKVNSGEYKLMGLAPYGEPVYVDLIYENLIDVKEDGSYCLNTEYFGYLNSMKTTNEKFHQLFDGQPRDPESRICKKQMDLAASIQKVTEDVVIKLAKHARKITESSNLCLAGGVALNCVANGKLLKENIFENIWIQPAAGDAGGALGAALAGAHMYFKQPRNYPIKGNFDIQQGSYIGPQFSDEEIKAFIERNSYPFKKIEDEKERNNLLAEALDHGKIIGFFNGRMEFGPRSLGARSIIGDSRKKEMQSTMNLKVKFRESFRPFAPAVLAEDVNEYFELNQQSPYMLLVAPVKKERRKTINNVSDDSNDDMIEIINQERSDIPAITHVDYSARIQTVHQNTNPEFYNLINAFKKRTGCSVIVNTSFNVRGEPIVCIPKDAYTCFMRTEIDILVLENYLLFKEEQPKFEDEENWKGLYELD